MNINDYIAVNTHLEESTINNENVLRVIKSNKIDQPDENTYVKLVDSDFHNGTIEVMLYSKLLDNAPSHSRGFIGIAFRIGDDDLSFESLYVRPTNGNTDDPVRKNRVLQYFSYPTYTFDYFRNKNFTDYEGPANINLNEWIKLKAIIKYDKADLYINDNLVLRVDDLKHGKYKRGSVGIFVDIGTDGYFKDLNITYDD